ncbi:MAG: SPFH domain-containing protein [Planctomycetota bacterium]|jgi:membrane protease subunit HflC
MNKVVAISIGAILLLLLLIFSTTYSVSFHEVAIRRTFGKSTAESVVTDPGLRWKWPIIQETATYDTRLQVHETTSEEISTADGQQIVVKAFLLWRVDDSMPERVLAFDETYNSVEDARDALGAPFLTALTGSLSEYALEDLLGQDNRLAEAETKIVTAMTPLTSKGIQPVSVGISQLLLPERTTSAVIARMQATRQKLAEAKRYEGTAAAEGITARAATQAQTIRTFAELRATEIRSEAEASSAKYLQQMSEEENLAIFLVWLDTLEAALSQNATFVLDPNFAPWHLLMLGEESTSDAGDFIPQPSRGTGPQEVAARDGAVAPGAVDDGDAVPTGTSNDTPDGH